MVTIIETVRQHSNPITEKLFGLPGEESSGLSTQKFEEVLYRLRRIEMETPKTQQNSDED